jgi:hypothetical protein
VEADKRDFRDRAEAELQDYRNRESFEAVITRAAWCMTQDEDGNDKRHSHHYRRSKETLRSAEKALQTRAADLRKCETFDELHKMIWREIRKIKWIKQLYAYDVATWIGANLGREPELVYLHAGAAVGAAALGFEGRETLDPQELPTAFQLLRPYEMEDCLCIYKQDLKRIAKKNAV